MTKRKGLIAVWVLLLLLGMLPSVPAQAAPQEDPATPDEPAVPEPQDEDVEGGMPFALYVGFAGGMGEDDGISSTIFADELNGAISEVTIDDVLYGKGVIGWKLQHGKGDFRFIFQGYKEEEFGFTSVGASTRLPNGNTADLDSGLVPWWFVEINGGDFSSSRLIPMWDSNADTMFGDSDGVPDFGPCEDIGGSMFRCGEITYDAGNPDQVVTGTGPDDLQNRINTYDVVYGREFGGRRFGSRWWGGLRYFEYEGQMLATAWLNTGQAVPGGTSGAPGEHFTDGSFLPFLNITQTTTGFGPVGSWEADFNYYNKALQLYIRGEAAFTFNTMEMDSGNFFQIVDEGSSSGPAQLLEDRLVKELDKSSWQDRAEVGARLYMKNGLQFEIAYSIAGFLDFVLLPDLLQVGVTNEAPQTVTHDFVFDTLHVGAGFQF